MIGAKSHADFIRASGLFLPASTGRRHDRARDVHNSFKETLDKGRRPDMTRAIEILVDEGLVNRRQGLGSFVAAPRLKRTATYLLSFTEAVPSQGRVASHRLLYFGPVPWRQGLPYPEDLPLVGLDRLRLVDRVPTAIHRSIVSAEFASSIGLNADTAEAPRFSLYRLLDNAGLTIASGSETLTARHATEEEAKLLELGDDRVVMAVQRQTSATNGMILDAVDAVYDARRYSYRAELRRDPPATLAGFTQRL